MSRKQVEQELDEELSYHLEREIEEHLASGMNREDARRAALRSFSGFEQEKEECRDMRGLNLIDNLVRDLRYALRMLSKTPGFTTIALLILAVGIGSNLTVFSLIDSLFLKPIPVHRPDELVRIASLDREGHLGGITSAILEPLRHETTLAGVCGFSTPRLTAEVGGEDRSVGTLALTGDCFETLGVQPQLGRMFTSAEDKEGAESVALLTDSLWHTGFAARRDVIGKTIHVQGSSFTIIGVTERRFDGVLLGWQPGLIIPLQQMPLDTSPGAKRPKYFWVDIFARRAPGISERQVQTRIDVLRQSLLEATVPTRYNAAQRQDYLSRKLLVSSAETGVDRMLRGRFGQPLYAFAGICATVLLVACLNLITLLLARGLARQREIAVRLALGAQRSRVVMLFAFDSLLLVIGGSLFGLLFGFWASHAVIAQASAIFPNLSLNVSLDSRAALFFALEIILIAIAFCAASSWQVTRMGGSGNLKENARGILGRAVVSQKLLLGAQVALTLALVAGSTLLTSSFEQLRKMNLGFQTHGVWAAMLSPRTGGYRDFDADSYYREMLRRIRELPEVSSASLSDFAPLWTGAYQDSISSVENSHTGRELQGRPVWVTDGFFTTLGIPILAGRDLRPDDSTSEEPIAVVSRTLADLLGGNSLIGQHVRIGSDKNTQSVKVVGIAGEAQLSLENPEQTKPPTVYLCLRQYPDRERYAVALIKAGNGRPLSPAAIRRIVQDAGREYVETFQTLDSNKEQALVENRMLAYLSSAFGFLALLLAATGLFGLLSYQVGTRVGEIGVRIALGAQRSQIYLLVIQEVSFVVLGGIISGLVITSFASKLLTGLIFGISDLDLRSISFSVAVLIVTAFCAAFLPARKAASTDPLAALRQD
jgi:predicted permease